MMDFVIDNAGNEALNSTMEVASSKINSTTDFSVNISLNISTNTSNNDSQMYETSRYYYTSPGIDVMGIINLVFAIFGCLGNSLIIIMSIKAKSTLKPSMIYFTALAISDITVLVNNAIVIVVIKQLDWAVALTNPFVCKIGMWVGYSCVQVSSWILVAVTIERLIAITVPFKVKIICYPKVSKIIVFSIFIFIYGMNSHFLYGIRVQNGGLCFPLPGMYSFFTEMIYPWVEFSVAFAVPFVIIVIANSIISYKLYKRSQNLGKIANLQLEIRTKETSVTVMLVVVNVTFVILMSPWALYNVVYNNYENQWNDPTYLLLFDVCNTLTNLNSVCNFYLYILSGASFRKEVLSLLNRLRCGGNVQNVFVP